MNKHLHIILTLFILIISINLYSQQNTDSIPLSDQYIVFEGDTLLIELDEIMLLKKVKFKTAYDQKYYYWFRKKVLKAYPYAKLASERLTVLNQRRDSIKSKSKKREYTIRVQKYMEGEFTDQLKKLTRTEGRILIKLIHRQTGETTYDVVKDLRSGWKAFWYNTTASMFKLSLKDKYNPEKNPEDYLIEDILQRAFLAGNLKEQPSKLKYDYINLSKKEIDVSSIVKKKK
ncbi:DUF4294 domain-containing protein [Lutibacter sp.]|uniref:DUF4294 domain-containing protein n=1 Tax=Lutibacter sp. TaxID=1925666 RepID=UPI001A2CF8E5|nr:DUF4294 domain-containing protein [Lutibacter sp.]MBI9041655.1 DUF4294 domain-containing protein [Lutibacter sp.]